MAWIVASEKLAHEITCYIDGLDSTYSYNDRTIDWYYNGSYKGSSNLYAYESLGGDFTATGLSSGTTYTIQAKIYKGSSLIVTLTGTATTQSVTLWEWWTPKNQGSPFNVTPAEWLAFYNKIDQARAANGLGTYGFQRGSYYFTSGRPFYSWMMTQPATAIDDINGTVANELKTVTSGDRIYAWYFENLRVALNNSL